MLPFADALPAGEASKYVAAAYIVFVVLIVVYVAIMAMKLQRIERELRELASFAEQGNAGPGMPGREAEDMPGSDETQPPAGSDRNLTPSGPVGGRADQAQGASDV
jgi:CcmD family protein